ncbi:thiamine pyrophosphate-binding protein [Micromonospora tarapacensis]|uniref:thiamine pyrophosphate-binding protein n=1 Tax=Micromonospora tarapacensis TaxID=2835305 RepID=UPI0038B3A311
MTGQAPTTASGRLVATLRAHGVDRIFCVPGESFLPVLDGLADAGIDLVTCRHEGGAAFMALADAKLTGQPGVVLVNRGPGATNAAIAVHSADLDATGLLLVVGDVHTGERGRRSFQELDHRAAFAGMSRGVFTVEHPHHVAEFTSRAFAAARGGVPGPAVLVVPEDVLTESVPPSVGGHRRWPNPPCRPPTRWPAPWLCCPAASGRCCSPAVDWTAPTVGTHCG